MSTTRSRSVRAIAATCAALLLLAPWPARAASVMLEDLTWTELRDAIAAGSTTVIVPVGGTEQNGPHMALGKHNVRVRLLARRIAESLGGTIVAPVLAYVPEGGIDPPQAHMRYPGTITVPSAAFVATLESAGRSLRRAGFRDVVIIGEHGGYRRELATAAERLNRAWAGTPARAHAVDDYYAAAETDFARALAERGLRPDEIGAHAGAGDTSLTLALAPDLVRQDALASPASRNANGVRGDPARASAELGALGADIVVRRTVAAIRAALRR
jgi:creatinine amidohydrolase